MKRTKLLAIGILVVAFVVFFMTRPTRERACMVVPNATASNDPQLKAKCDEQGGVIVNGECSCPEPPTQTTE